MSPFSLSSLLCCLSSADVKEVTTIGVDVDKAGRVDDEELLGPQRAGCAVDGGQSPSGPCSTDLTTSLELSLAPLAPSLSSNRLSGVDGHPVGVTPASDGPSRAFWSSAKGPSPARGLHTALLSPVTSQSAGQHMYSELLRLAVVNWSGDIPIISLTKLQAALNSAAQAVAVIRLVPTSLSAFAAASSLYNSSAPSSPTATRRQMPGGQAQGSDATALVARPPGFPLSHQPLLADTVFVNQMARLQLNLSQAADYQAVLDAMAADDPLLQGVLRHAATSLQDGLMPDAVLHTLPRPLQAGFAALSAVRVTACAMRDGGGAGIVARRASGLIVGRPGGAGGGGGGGGGMRGLPGCSPVLFIEHVVEVGESVEMQQRVLRNCMMLSRVSAILTVFDLSSGAVLQQNARSVDYLGNLMRLRPTGSRNPSRGPLGGAGAIPEGGLGPQLPCPLSPSPGKNMLRKLFQLDPDKLDEMLEELTMNDDDTTEWRGVVRVPGSLREPARPGTAPGGDGGGGGATLSSDGRLPSPSATFVTSRLRTHSAGASSASLQWLERGGAGGGSGTPLPGVSPMSGAGGGGGGAAGGAGDRSGGERSGERSGGDRSGPRSCEDMTAALSGRATSALLSSSRHNLAFQATLGAGGLRRGGGGSGGVAGGVQRSAQSASPPPMVRIKILPPRGSSTMSLSTSPSETNASTTPAGPSLAPSAASSSRNLPIAPLALPFPPRLSPQPQSRLSPTASHLPHPLPLADSTTPGPQAGGVPRASPPLGLTTPGMERLSASASAAAAASAELSRAAMQLLYPTASLSPSRRTSATGSAGAGPISGDPGSATFNHANLVPLSVADDDNDDDDEARGLLSESPRMASRRQPSSPQGYSRHSNSQLPSGVLLSHGSAAASNSMLSNLQHPGGPSAEGSGAFSGHVSFPHPERPSSGGGGGLMRTLSRAAGQALAAGHRSLMGQASLGKPVEELGPDAVARLESSLSLGCDRSAKPMSRSPSRRSVPGTVHRISVELARRMGASPPITPPGASAASCGNLTPVWRKGSGTARRDGPRVMRRDTSTRVISLLQTQARADNMDAELSGRRVSGSSNGSKTPLGSPATSSRQLNKPQLPRRSVTAPGAMGLGGSERGSNSGSATGTENLQPQRTSGASTAETNAAEGEEEEEEEVDARWHELIAEAFLDPVTDKQVVLVTQTDVTSKVKAEAQLAELTEASIALLELIFPRHVIEHMTRGGPEKAIGPAGLASAPDGLLNRDFGTLDTKHPQVTIMFADCVGFTSMSKEVEPEDVMHFLHELYMRYDDLLDEYGVYKVETVGDCYVVAGGLIKKDAEGFACVDDKLATGDESHARAVFGFAKAMLHAASTVLMPHNGEPVRLRVGLHSGPIVSGVVGKRMPKFVLVGDTMNTASRMETTCRVGCIHVSADTRALLSGEPLDYTGGVDVKGKGRMDTFLYDPASLEDSAIMVASSPLLCPLRLPADAAARSTSDPQLPLLVMTADAAEAQPQAEATAVAGVIGAAASAGGTDAVLTGVCATQVKVRRAIGRRGSLTSVSGPNAFAVAEVGPASAAVSPVALLVGQLSPRGPLGVSRAGQSRPVPASPRAGSGGGGPSGNPRSVAGSPRAAVGNWGQGLMFMPEMFKTASGTLDEVVSEPASPPPPLLAESSSLPRSGSALTLADQGGEGDDGAWDCGRTRIKGWSRSSLDQPRSPGRPIAGTGAAGGAVAGGPLGGLLPQAPLDALQRRGGGLDFTQIMRRVSFSPGAASARMKRHESLSRARPSDLAQLVVRPQLLRASVSAVPPS